MTIRNLFLATIVGICVIFINPVNAQQLQFYTTFPKQVVSPGEIVTYNVEVLNNSNQIITSGIQLLNLPNNWSSEIRSGNFVADEISIIGKERKSIELKVFVPQDVKKGQYTVRLNGSKANSLPLTIEVGKNGTANATFSSSQTNMQGAATSTFTFNASLYNASAQQVVYALQGKVQPGWGLVFKAEGKEVSSVNIDAYQKKDITIEITPPEGIAKGTYKIPVQAVGAASSELTFDVVVTGSYKLQLTTSNAKLNTDATSGVFNTVELILKNTGSSDLHGINLSVDNLSDWEVIFEPTRINTLKAGEVAKVNAKIKPSSKAVAGDYMLNIQAKNNDTSSKMEMRVTVETSILRGWIGMLLIVAAVGLIYYLIKRYGRR